VLVNLPDHPGKYLDVYFNTFKIGIVEDDEESDVEYFYSQVGEVEGAEDFGYRMKSGDRIGIEMDFRDKYQRSIQFFNNGFPCHDKISLSANEEIPLYFPYVECDVGDDVRLTVEIVTRCKNYPK
jgi:hypothetical protein